MNETKSLSSHDILKEKHTKLSSGGGGGGVVKNKGADQNGLPPSLGNFADISYLKENYKLL